MPRTFTLPTIHKGGDAKATLLDQHREAHRALRAAAEAMAKCRPNFRNFYTQGPDAGAAAAAEHEERIGRLSALYEEFGELTRAIARLPETTP